MKKLILPIVISVCMILIGVLGGHSFSGWMGAALLVFAALMWFVASSRNSGRVAEGKEWLGRFPGVKYGFAYGEYGIAVDAANDVIHLKDAGRGQVVPIRRHPLVANKSTERRYEHLRWWRGRVCPRSHWQQQQPSQGQRHGHGSVPDHEGCGQTRLADPVLG